MRLPGTTRLRATAVLTAAVAAAAAAAALPAAASAATPGALDSAFAGGIVGTGGSLRGVAVEPNGEVIAAGGTGSGLLVVCRNANGSAAGAGQFSGGGGEGNGVAIAPDGTAVVAGTDGGIFIQQFDPGTCAPKGARSVAAPLGGGARAAGVAVGPDGKIVAAGQIPITDSSGPNSSRPAVARFNPNGTLDTSFGSAHNGTLIINHGQPDAFATAVAVQGDGKVLVAGQWQATLNVPNGFIARLTQSGADDSSFAGGASVYQYYSHGAGYASFYAITLQNDGKIVAAGSDVAGPSAMAVRLNPNGSPDTGFGGGGDGSVRLSSGTFSPNPYGAYGVGIAGGGRVVTAGSINNNGEHQVGLWAFTPAGAPDSEGAFSGGIDTQQANFDACGLAVAPDGGLVVVGRGAGEQASGPQCEASAGGSGFIARYVGFGPPPPPGSPAKAPTVSTGGATQVTEVGATVSGQVNPNGASTNYHFDYGTTGSYGSSTPSTTLGGSGASAVSATIGGLSPDTTYHYRLVAGNSAGTSKGGDRSFTTGAATGGGGPSAHTGSASAGEVTATIRGRVTSGAGGSYHFEYGTTKAYGAKTADAAVPSGGGAVGVSANLLHLRPGTTYHYRLVAQNGSGVSDGADRTFKTLGRVKVGLGKVGRSVRTAALSKSGLRVRVGCDQGCTVRGALVIPAKLAKRLHLGHHAINLATGSTAVRAGKSRVLTIRLTRNAAKLLARLQGASLVVRLSAVPAGGGPAQRLTRTVVLAR